MRRSSTSQNTINLYDDPNRLLTIFTPVHGMLTSTFEGGRQIALRGRSLAR
jgi:hypothetical protein